MKKKIAAICAMVMLIMTFAQSASAINVIMNSSYLEFPDQEPVIVDWVTLVPLRAIAETLGLEVTWDDPSDTVTLKKDNFYIELVIGSTTAKTAAGTKTLAVAPRIINGRTMVPIRFIAEELGLTVSWNAEYMRVIINGQVDTQKIIQTPVVEDTTDISENATEADNAEVDNSNTNNTDKNTEEEFEEETDFIEDIALTTIEGQSSSITFEIPVNFYEDDTENEESFAYRSLDAFDAQHTYNWEIVSRYESYADESGTNGILFIVQDLGPYQGEDYDVARIMDEYPEEPERPELDFGYIMEEVERIIMEQLCAEREVEYPDNYAEMTSEEQAEYFGFESDAEMGEYMNTLVEEFDMMQIPEYAEYVDWQVANSEYRAEVNEINNARSYAVRNFSSVASQFDDETWAAFFSGYFNSDEEVRYDGVEIIDYDGKKVIHATIYAEDPDDEQGVYDYYHYIDGDSVITIFGGTLFGSEASPEAVDVLSRMNVG